MSGKGSRLLMAERTVCVQHARRDETNSGHRKQTFRCGYVSICDPVRVYVEPPFSICEETSTQNPCVFALCRLIILAKKSTIAAPQKTEGE